MDIDRGYLSLAYFGDPVQSKGGSRKETQCQLLKCRLCVILLARVPLQILGSVVPRDNSSISDETCPERTGNLQNGVDMSDTMHSWLQVLDNRQFSSRS